MPSRQYTRILLVGFVVFVLVVCAALFVQRLIESGVRP